MARIISLVWLTGVLVLGAVSSAGAVGAEIAFGGWMQCPSGIIGYQPSGETDLLDLEENLMYDDETRAYARMYVDMPFYVPNVYLMAAPMEFDSDGLVENGFNFGGSAFEAGSFYSEMEWKNIDIGLYYGVPFFEKKNKYVFNIDFGLNLRLIDYELIIRQPENRLTKKTSDIIYLPLLFLAVQFRPMERLSVEVEGRGISYDENEILSLIGRVEVKIAGPVFLAGGYRYEKSKLDEDDIQADMEFSGPFLELGLSL